MISGVSTGFGQVRFDGARVPAANLVGAPGEGWKLAMTVVTHEREPSTLGFTARHGKTVRSLAARVAASGGAAARRPRPLPPVVPSPVPSPPNWPGRTSRPRCCTRTCDGGCRSSSTASPTALTDRSTSC